MKVKISKSTIALVVVIIAIGWFFVSSSDKKSPNQNNQAQNQTSLTTNPQNTVTIDVIANQFSFNPNPIRVKYGDRVVLNITSQDVTHGFALPDFGINAILNPGETTTVEFVANKRGRFGFYCSVPCGVGHVGMRGNIIVE